MATLFYIPSTDNGVRGIRDQHQLWQGEQLQHSPGDDPHEHSGQVGVTLSGPDPQGPALPPQDCAEDISRCKSWVIVLLGCAPLARMG